MKFYIITIIILAYTLSTTNCASDNNGKTNNKGENNNKNDICLLNLPGQGEDRLRASVFADTVLYIPLETTPESFMTDIQQLWMNDTVILVSCYNVGLLMFNEKGQFIKRIGNIGRGPSEYLLIFHFEVMRDTIYISSTGKKGFIRYTLNGSFCDEIRYNYSPVFFTTTTDQKMASYDRKHGYILVYNKNIYTPDTIVVEHGVTKGRFLYSEFNPCKPYLQKTPSGLLFNSYRSDTIWNISGTIKEPAYILNMEGNLLPYDKQIEFSNGNYKGWQESVKPYQYVHLIPGQSVTLILQQYWWTVEYDAIYLNDRITSDIRKYNTSCIYDDITGEQDLSYFFPICPDKYLAASLTPIAILDFIDKEKGEISEKPSPSWLRQMKSLKKDDNPVLVLIRIKTML